MRQTRSRLGCLPAPRGREAGRALSAALAFLLAWLQGIPPSFSAEFRVFRKTYLRAAGAPETVADSFGVLNSNTTWTLRAINGSLEDPSVGKVSSATLTLNGIEVLRPNQFNQHVGLIEGPVIVLSSNTVATQLRSKPGGQLTVEIVGQDTTPPTAQWLAPSSGQFLNTATVSAQLRLTDDIAGLNPASLQILLDAGSVLTAFPPVMQPTLHAALNASLAIAAEGIHTLRAEVRDLAGQLASASVSFTVDRTPPVITTFTPTNGITLNTPRPTITASFSDQLSGIDASSVRLSLDGRDVTAQATVTEASISFAPTADLADGTHTAQLRVADRAGNLATAQTTFTILTGPPVTPQSGFIHGQVFDAHGQPLPDARITVRSMVGEVRSSPDGRYQFPTPGSGHFIVNVTKAGFTSVQRPISVLATRDVAVAPAYLTPLDAKVTLITPGQGGVATDSSGTFQVEFPPGAAPRDLEVRITPLPLEQQLPGSLPEGRQHLQAVFFEPRFTVFNQPAIFRFRNSRNLPPNAVVNLELWNESAQRWTDVDPGIVTPDGRWVEFRILRFFCWYCSWLRRRLPAGKKNPDPQRVTTTTTEAKNPGQGCPQKGNSTICPESGDLGETHTLPTIRMLGQARSLTFTYRSTAASPSVLLGTDYFLDTVGDPAEGPTIVPVTTSATIQIEGQLIQASFAGASGSLRQSFLWDGRNARGELVSTGAYPYTVKLSNNYEETFGTTGIPMGELTPLTTAVQARAIVVNQRDSVFGAGWSLNGLQRLLPQPDGTMLVTDGDGSATVFRPGPMADVVVADSSNGVSVLVGHGDGTFQPQQRFVAGHPPPAANGLPIWVAVGDFNGDGFQDLAVALLQTSEVAILLGEGGTFQPPRYVAVGPAPSFVAVVDLNGDGLQDLVVVNQSSNDVSILLGRGDGTFQPQRRFVVGNSPTRAAVGDVNRDGRPDIVTANQSASDLSVLLGNGDGTFQPERRVSVDSGPLSVVLADFNRDGSADLAVAYGPQRELSILLGNGDGTFRSQMRVRMFPSFAHLAVGDFNADTIPDLAVTSLFAAEVTVLLGRGDGTFQPPQPLPVGGGPFSIAVTDLNQDGLQDLATANQLGDVSILLGNGDGTFQRQRRFPTVLGAAGMAVGEFNDRLGDPAKAFTGLPGDFSQLKRNPDGTFVRILTDGTKILFDARGLHQKTIDRNGNETLYRYDAQDRLSRIEFPGGAAFTFAYNPLNGHLASIGDSSGRITQFLIDGDANLRKITTPDGTIRQLAYDAEHRLIAQTNERGFTTDYVYDTFGRLSQATLPERPIVDPATGAAALQREVRQFTPAETQGLINALSAGVGTPANPAAPVATPLAAFRDGQGHTTQLATDHFGAPTKLIDPLGRTTTIERDVNGLPTKITRPNSTDTFLTYDGRGNLTSTKEDVTSPRLPAYPLPVRV